MVAVSVKVFGMPSIFRGCEDASDLGDLLPSLDIHCKTLVDSLFLYPLDYDVVEEELAL